MSRQGLSFGGMGADSAVDEQSELCFTCNQEFLAYTSKHLGTLGHGVGFCSLKRKPFALGSADKSELGLRPRNWFVGRDI